MPADLELPICGLCGAGQTFFFQVTFPPDHFWADLTMAVFACTSCAQRGHFIPEMLQGELRGFDIPATFLDAYQRNFRTLVFESCNGVVRNDYVEEVRFRPWKLVRVPDLRTEGTKVGGEPVWLLEDETPGTYGGAEPMGFLMQLQEEYEFDRLPGAPPQATLDLRGRVKDATEPFYSLFLGNRLYFFGTRNRQEPRVYMLTQVD